LGAVPGRVRAMLALYQWASREANRPQAPGDGFEPGGQLRTMAPGNRRAVIETGGQEANGIGQRAGYRGVFSPDGRTLACAADSGAVRLGDALTCKERRVLHGQDAVVQCVTSALDGRTVATASRDGTVRLRVADRASPRSLLLYASKGGGIHRCSATLANR